MSGRKKLLAGSAFEKSDSNHDCSRTISDSARAILNPKMRALPLIAIRNDLVIRVIAAIVVGMASAQPARGGTICGRTGPDVIVGDLQGVTSYGAVGDISAFAIGTTSCNVGDTDLNWIANTDQHPLIGQNIYRLKDGRLEQVGMSWLKHGFFALTQDLCGCNCNNHGGSVLGVGCSDPYSAPLNGQQGSPGTGGLGPRFEVNAYTGAYAFPYSSQGLEGDAIYKRCQVHNSDMDPVLDGGGLYFMEGHYISPDDAAAGNQNNNASYRPMKLLLVVDTWTAGTAGPTVREDPAVRAWQDNDPSVVETDVQVPNDGLLILAAKATGLENGMYRYEYALHNLNSDRSGQSFSVPVIAGATIENVGFHDVDYHSGDGIGSVNFDGTDWPATVGATSISWSTDTFATNESANALRWGTLYNFRFDANVLPEIGAGPVTLGLFKPGTPTDVTPSTVVPSDTLVPLTIWLPNGAPGSLLPSQQTEFDVLIVPGTENLVPGSVMLHHQINGGGFQVSPLASLGGDLYRATLPPAECDDLLEFYVSAAGDGGADVANPRLAPAALFAPAIGGTVVALADDFETDQGWTVVNTDLTDGGWERGVPVGGGDLGDPAVDYDGSGQCYLTGNVDGESDVDGGPTELISPTVDLSGAVDPYLEYARWMSTTQFNGDHLLVAISNNDGADWVLVEDVTNRLGWNFVSFRVSDLVAPTSLMKVRFSVADPLNNSQTEAAIDAVSFTDFHCDQPCIPADVNHDDEVDARDIERFVQISVSGGGTPWEVCAADLDQPPDGVVDSEDVDEFVAYLLNGGCLRQAGDVNGDGAVNGLDIAALIQLMFNNPIGPFAPGFCAADLNGDDVIDDADALLLVDLLAPPIPPGACCFPDGGCVSTPTETACGDLGGDAFHGAGSGCGSVLCPIRPENNNCADAEAIMGEGLFPFDNTDATTDGRTHPECDSSGIDLDVWYCWTADCDGVVRVETCGQTAVDTKIAVYDNCALCTPTSVNLIDCNDDACGLQSSLDFVAVNGQSYLIRMGASPGASGGAGMFAIQCLGYGAGDDDCSSAQSSSAIAGEGTFFFDTSSATTVGPDHAACDFFAQPGIDHDVWFCWTAPCDGDVTIETCGQTTIDTKLAVYDNCTTCPPTDAALLACNDDEPGCNLQSRVTITAVNSNNYLIRLGTYPGSAGGFATFTITCGAP